MDGLNLAAGARPGAAVLLEHPRVKDADGRGAPVLAVAEVDKGRTMALTVDASWRWGFDEAGAGHGNQAYLRFWKNALRWLVGDPADLPVTVETTRENYTLGEEVELRVQARDVAFTPVPGARVAFTVRAPDGDRALEAVADAGGVAVATVRADTRGAWRVSVRAEAASGVLGEAATVFAVTTRDPELEELEPDAVFLQALAARAGGLYVAPGASTDPLRDPESGRVVKERAEVALAGAPIVPLLVLLCAGVAWTLRRRGGLR
jgi:hypothetical protein